jgi:hypothetical protein
MFIEANALAVLLTGFTHYVDVGKGTEAIMFYRDAKQVHMTLPGGPTLVGEWNLLADGYYVKWTNGPQGKWQIKSSPGELVYIDPTGQPAGKVTRIVPGNAAKF